MANSQADGVRRMRRRHKSHSELEGEKFYESGGKEKVSLEPDVSEVRRIRVERLEGSTTTRRSSATTKMTSESYATLPSLKSRSSHRRRKESHRDSEGTRHRRRRKSTSKDDSATYVYGAPADKSTSSRITISETRALGQDGESSESDDESTKSEPVKTKTRKRKVRVIYVTAEEAKERERRARADKAPSQRPKESEETIHRSRAQDTRRKSTTDVLPASASRRYNPLM